MSAFKTKKEQSVSKTKIANPHFSSLYLSLTLTLLMAIDLLDGAEESNLHTEKKYQKDAKIGEGTYAIVYRGKILLNCHQAKWVLLTHCILFSLKEDVSRTDE
jgi:hypothetical protein